MKNGFVHFHFQLSSQINGLNSSCKTQPGLLMIRSYSGTKFRMPVLWYFSKIMKHLCVLYYSYLLLFVISIFW